VRVRVAGSVFALLAVIAGGVSCGGRGGSFAGAPALPSDLRQPGGSPIEQVVIVIQENRSFDNLFATFPGADGTSTGKAAAMSRDEQQYCRGNGMPAIAKPTTVSLKKTDLFGAGFGKDGNFDYNTDLAHVHKSFVLERRDGAMDGFDLTGTGADGSGFPTCTYTYQYVDPNEIQPYWDIAKQYVLADHTFQTQGSGSFTGHQDLIAGGTQIDDDEALIDNPSYFPWGCDANKSVRTAVIKRNGKVYPFGGPFPCLAYSTLRDLLDAKSVSWKFYATPVQSWKGCRHGNTAGIWSAFGAIKAVRYGPEWHKNIAQNNTVFFTDVDKGVLPAVSWITPDGANSDHPAEYKRPPCGTPPPSAPPEDHGPSWVASIVNAVGQSRYWKSTVIVVVWDDWGGFYDHVAPPHPYNWQGGPGFRVPMLIVSPFVKPHVDHTVYQFGSILRFVEQTWGLGSLGKNDADSTSIRNAFDFSMKPRSFKKIGGTEPQSFFMNQTPSGNPPDTE
jgi:phospholipase C